jgi:hypothetical protein
MTLIVNFKVRHWLQAALPVDECVDVTVSRYVHGDVEGMSAATESFV